MLIPSTSAAEGAKALLEILVPSGVEDPVIPLRFNPTEYQLQKANTFAELAIPGLESPPLQYVRGSAETLTAELLVDTSDTLDDVRERYTNKLRGLMNINGEIHAPPIVRLTWDTEIFKGVVESLGITYVLFTPDGVPIRARLSVVLKEYRTVEDQVGERPRFSPDVEKTHVVRRGDTLASIAGLAYNDVSKWREVARSNGIADPRSLVPGMVLNLPRLR